MTRLRLLISGVLVAVVIAATSCTGTATIGESAASQPAESASSTSADASVAPVEETAPLTEAQRIARWCADVAPNMQDALKHLVIVSFGDPDSLPEAVEELHTLYRRQSSDTVPVEIQPMIQQVNEGLDVLEPIMRPIGWDYDQIDRSFVEEADRAYTDAGVTIDEYNAETCGLPVAGMLPTEAEMDAFADQLADE